MPIIKRHTKSTHANTTLATDGTHLVAMLGSEGLHTFDMNGKLLWKKDLGVLDSGFYMVPAAQWEFSSSPVIHDGSVIIQADVQKNSFLGAFDVKTGKELWRTSRSDVPTFSTPTIHQVGTQTQILVNGWRHSGAYDFKTGKEIWRMKNVGGDIPTPVPVVGFGLVFMTSAHGPQQPLQAIRESATGDISLAAGETSNEHIVWSANKDGAYMISPVLYGGLLYVSKNNGVFVVFDAKTGERLYQQRLGTGTTGVHGVDRRGRRQDLFHERGRRRLRRQGRPDVRAPRDQPARRHRHGDAGNFRGRSLFQDRQKPHGDPVIGNGDETVIFYRELTIRKSIVD